jgi:hypothetical protein
MQAAMKKLLLTGVAALLMATKMPADDRSSGPVRYQCFEPGTQYSPLQRKEPTQSRDLAPPRRDTAGNQKMDARVRDDDAANYQEDGLLLSSFAAQ